MSRFPVSARRERELVERMERLGIFEDDLEERFVRGSGPGGQKINKTASCVQLRHVPTGIEVRCQVERSRALNRYRARIELCDRIEASVQSQLAEAEQEREREKRRKRRPSKRQRERTLEEKKHQSKKKVLRRRPGDEA